jgi:hypothetical protein
MKIKDIAEQIRTQDNRMTHNPIFIVQEKRRIYGFDPAYTNGDDIVWIDSANDCAEADSEERERLEAEWGDTGEEPDGWTRTACQDRWEFVTACFTEEGCKDYLRQNGHNLGETRIYVASGYRNDEWEAVREHLKGIK